MIASDDTVASSRLLQRIRSSPAPVPIHVNILKSHVKAVAELPLRITIDGTQAIAGAGQRNKYSVVSKRYGRALPTSAASPARSSLPPSVRGNAATTTK